MIIVTAKGKKFEYCLFWSYCFKYIFWTCSEQRNVIIRNYS